jgi:hypothetical protein
MECEHILPIITALSHWWLIKDKNHSASEIENLSFEYDWSHRCCNQIKSNVDFIVYDASSKGNFEYKVNMLMINSVLNKIKTEAKYDCKEIEKKSKIQTNQHLNIAKQIQPIVNEINANALLFDSHSEYLLLTKYKVLSALSDDDFINSIIGNDDNTTNNPIPKRKNIRQIIIEKRALMKELDRQRDLEKRKQYELQKQARDLRAMGRTGGGLEDEINELSIDEILEKNELVDYILDYDLPEYNEFDEFDDTFIIKSILTRPKYNPTLTELTDIFEKIFVQNTYINWDPFTNATHTRFYENEIPKFTQSQKNTGLLPFKISTSPMNKNNIPLTRSYTTTELRKTKRTGLIPDDILNKISSSSSESSNRQTKKRRIAWEK